MDVKDPVYRNNTLLGLERPNPVFQRLGGRRAPRSPGYHDDSSADEHHDEGLHCPRVIDAETAAVH